MARKTKGKPRRRPRKTQKGRRGRKQTRKYKGGTSSINPLSLHLSDLQGSIDISELQTNNNDVSQESENLHTPNESKPIESKPVTPSKKQNALLYPAEFNIASTIDLKAISNASNSNNGMVVEWKTYGKKYVLKIPQPGDSVDNLIYEFDAGLYINMLRTKYPCFINTYALFYLNPDTDGQETSNKKHIAKYMKNKAFITNEDIRKGRLQNIFNNISNVTDDKPKYDDEYYSEKQNFALLLEHIEGKTLRSIIHTLDETEIAKIFYQIYGPLAALEGEFSHNDLHVDNIMITEMKEPIRFHYTIKTYTATSFTTKYLARMIDYGRVRMKEIDLKNFYMNVNKPLSIAAKQKKLHSCGLWHLLYHNPDPDRLGTTVFGEILKDLVTAMGNDSTTTTKTITVNSNYGMETNVDFLNDVLREDLDPVSTELFRESDLPPPPPNFP